MYIKNIRNNIKNKRDLNKKVGYKKITRKDKIRKINKEEDKR